MTPPVSLGERPRLAVRAVLALAGAALAMHLLVSLVMPYGLHRDEFLYLAMGRHLRLWRMDFPPFIAVVSLIERSLLGDSLVALHLVPALTSGLLVLLAALLARELGGGRFAQVFAAFAVLANVYFERSAVYLMPVVFDAFWWTLAFFALLRLCRGDEPLWRWWVLLGAAGGLGLLTKFSVLFLGFGVLVGLLATRWRRSLLTPWPYLALLLALVIGSPSIVGQVALGWPLVTQMVALKQYQLQHVSLAGFFAVQVMFGPTLLVGAVGGAALLFAPSQRTFRLVGWTCLAVWVTLLVLHGKAYYVGPTYGMLIAAGAVALERIGARRGRTVRGWAVGLTAGWGLVALPFGFPILGPKIMAPYARAVFATEALRDTEGQLLRLPQDYADMLGWRDRAAALGAAYRTLSPKERAEAVILAYNYGEAGAAEFYGPRYGLPPVVCSEGSYWFFGPGTRPGAVAVTIGETAEGLRQWYDSVVVAGRVTNPMAARWEQDLTIYIARRPKTTLQALWPSLAGRSY